MKKIIITISVVILLFCFQPANAKYQDFGPYGYGGNEGDDPFYDQIKYDLVMFGLDIQYDYFKETFEYYLEKLDRGLYILGEETDEYEGKPCKLLFISNGVLVILPLNSLDNIEYFWVADDLTSTGNDIYCARDVFIPTLMAGHFIFEIEEIDKILKRLNISGKYSDGIANIVYNVKDNIVNYFIFPDLEL